MGHCDHDQPTGDASEHEQQPFPGGEQDEQHEEQLTAWWFRKNVKLKPWAQIISTEFEMESRVRPQRTRCGARAGEVGMILNVEMASTLVFLVLFSLSHSMSPE